MENGKVELNWERYKAELRAQNVKGMEGLIKYLESMDFEVLPGSKSGNYHGSYPGGLIVHILTMLDFYRKSGKRFKEGNMEMCILLHDVGKVSNYRKHGERAVEIISEYIELNETETEAIFYHMGMYGARRRLHQEEEYPLVPAYRALENKFVLFLHLIDNYCANFVEVVNDE